MKPATHSLMRSHRWALTGQSERFFRSCLTLQKPYARTRQMKTSPRIAFGSKLLSRLLHQLAVVVQRRQAEEVRARAKLLLDAQQLVVLGDAVGARG